METKQPSITAWRTLYDLADKFKKDAPWRWMWDSDVFAIQSPNYAERGYCCVMGRNGEHFAFAVYLGTRGLQGFDAVARGEYQFKHPLSALHVQRCLMVSFEDREQLAEQDRDIITKLGLSYRGRQNWPLFRSYEPGFIPWHLTAGEAELLILALEQVPSITPRMHDDPEYLQRYDHEKFLTRIQPEKGAWTEQWLAPEPWGITPTILKPTPESIAHARQIPRTALSLEITSFFPPAPVDDKVRPYYPEMLLFADHNSGFIIHSNVLSKHKPAVLILPLELVSVIERLKILPQRILVARPEFFEALKHIASALAIELIYADELPMADQAEKSMYEFFAGQHKR